MPKRTDIKSILIIGAGPIVIGQACEFDYSGAQACKALREEGYRVILVNSNPATIMTDPEMADAIYIEPINWRRSSRSSPRSAPTRCCPPWAASVIRDRFSPDAWRALTELNEMIHAPFDQGPSESAIFERVNGALRILASFSGLAQENMSQLAGWRFLEIGRRIERTLATCAFIRQFAFGARPEGGLDVLLELADSQITYRLRYVMVAASRR